MVGKRTEIRVRVQRSDWESWEAQREREGGQDKLHVVHAACSAVRGSLLPPAGGVRELLADCRPLYNARITGRALSRLLARPLSALLEYRIMDTYAAAHASAPKGQMPRPRPVLATRFVCGFVPSG